MPREKTADDCSKMWRPLVPCHEKHSARLEISGISFSLKGNVKLDVECPACGDYELAIFFQGCVFAVSRLGPADDEKWQKVPLYCENNDCGKKLTILDICVSPEMDLLVEFCCFACGQGEVRSRTFSRRKRISMVFAASEIKTAACPADFSDSGEERPVFAAIGGRINALPVRPN